MSFVLKSFQHVPSLLHSPALMRHNADVIYGVSRPPECLFTVCWRLFPPLYCPVVKIKSYLLQLVPQISTIWHCGTLSLPHSLWQIIKAELAIALPSILKPRKCQVLHNVLHCLLTHILSVAGRFISRFQDLSRTSSIDEVFGSGPVNYTGQEFLPYFNE